MGVQIIFYLVLTVLNSSFKSLIFQVTSCALYSSPRLLFQVTLPYLQYRVPIHIVQYTSLRLLTSSPPDSHFLGLIASLVKTNGYHGLSWFPRGVTMDSSTWSDADTRHNIEPKYTSI